MGTPPLMAAASKPHTASTPCRGTATPLHIHRTPLLEQCCSKSTPSGLLLRDVVPARLPAASAVGPTVAQFPRTYERQSFMGMLQDMTAAKGCREHWFEHLNMLALQNRIQFIQDGPAANLLQSINGPTD